MKIIYRLNTAYDVLPKHIHPAEQLKLLGIKYGEYEGVPMGDCIRLHDVVPETVPNPVPEYLDVIEEGI